MNNSQLNIADLIFSYIRGNISEEEKELLDKWRKSSPENENLFKNLCSKESFTTKLETYKVFLAQSRYQNIQKHIKRQKVRTIYRYSSIAAALVLPLMVFYFFFSSPDELSERIAEVEQLAPGKPSAILHTAEGGEITLEAKDFEIKDKTGAKIVNKGNSLVYNKDSVSDDAAKERYNKVEVPRGGEYQLVLSDGTRVWLNSESSIKYPVVFKGDKRIVKVAGEAYFDVAHNKERPFIVVAGHTKVQVLGTEFNVRAYRDEDFIATTLVEGSVRAWYKEGTAETLKPSQQYMYDIKENKHIVKNVDIELYTSWRMGLFVFQKQKLEDILNTISRWYDVEFFFENNDVRNIEFTGRLKRYESARNLLKILEEMEDVKFRIKGKVVFVK